MKNVVTYATPIVNIGPAPTVPYVPSPLAQSVNLAPLPTSTASTVPWVTNQYIFYSPALVAAWGVKAAAAPANLSSSTPSVKAQAQDYIAAAYIAEQFVAGAYASLPAVVSSDVYWGNTTQPSVYDYEASNAALVYRTGYDRNGAVMSTPNKTALLNAIRNWLIAAASSNYLDTRLAGFRAPASGVPASIVNAATLNAVLFQRVINISAMVFVYDLIRADLPTADRILVENFFRFNGDWLKQALERQMAGVWTSWKYDRYDDGTTLATVSDGTTEWYVPTPAQTGYVVSYDYVDATPTYGPKVPTLATYYNNRVSNSVTALGLLGIAISETAFIAPAIRYYRDFLAYSVGANGSISEWGERAYNYGIPQQGRIYASTTVSGMAVLAMALYRAKGEQALYTYNTPTAKGLFTRGGAVKSLALTLDVQANLMTRTGAQANWFAVNQSVSAVGSQLRVTGTTFGTSLSTHLGTQEALFMGSTVNGGNYSLANIWASTGAWADSYHDVAAICAYDFYATTVAGVVPHGTTKTGTQLAGVINAVAQRSAALWTAATGSAPAFMPNYPGTSTINAKTTTVDCGRGSLNVVVPSTGTFATHGSQDGVIASPLFMYAP